MFKKARLRVANFTTFAESGQPLSTQSSHSPFRYCLTGRHNVLQHSSIDVFVSGTLS